MKEDNAARVSLPRRIFRSLFAPSCLIRKKDMLQNDFEGYGMYRAFLTIAWPAMLESILIGIVNFVDTLMVSGEGEAAIASIGLTGQPRLLFYVVLMAVTIGVNAVVARRKGQGDQEGANRVLTQALPIVFSLALLFFVIAYFLSEPLLRFAGAKDDTIENSISYFRITMFGMIFTSVSLTLNAAQRGCGKTRISMTTNLSANAVNVIFNALLINGLFFFPKLGVTGAAIATMLGNFTAMVISFLSVRRRGGYLFLRFRKLLKPKFDALAPVLTVAGGSMLEQVFMRIGFFLFVKIVADLGTNDFATHQIGMTILNLVFTIGDGLAVASSSLIGQNLGMRRRDRALVFGKIAQRFGWCASLIVIVSSVLLRFPIIRLFSDDEKIIETGATIMIFVGLISIFQIQQVLFSGCLRGAGDTKYMAKISFITIAIIRPVFSYILIYPLGVGLLGAWIVVLFDQILRFVFSATRFYGQKWCKVEL